MGGGVEGIRERRDEKEGNEAGEKGEEEPSGRLGGEGVMRGAFLCSMHCDLRAFLAVTVDHLPVRQPVANVSTKWE